MEYVNYNLASLPDEYRLASEAELGKRIEAVRKRLGEKLLILTHHYQRLEVVAFHDFIGDSYALAKEAAKQKRAEHIVFCGVRFMAEAADILTRPDQNVYLANPTAGCPMADMADAADVSQAWEMIESIVGPGRLTPVSYMNSNAVLKAFTGKHGGMVCTSSNADAAFRYYLQQGQKVFFFPDQHLGRNTCNKLGIPRQEVAVYDPNLPNGGLSDQEISKARVILWYGHCHVHMNFRYEHVLKVRQQYPGVTVIVHPECREEVVNAADHVGSTSFIVDFVGRAPAGATIAIGTEINLVHRLAVTNPDKKIIGLGGELCTICSNMFRTSLNDLCFTVENLDKAALVKVPSPISENARLALERMLAVGK